MSKPIVQWNLKIDPVVKDLVRLIAEAENMTMQQVVEETLKNHLIPKAADAEKILEIRRQAKR